jgi:glycosyltransferase involved in cell wall biosynthesis
MELMDICCMPKSNWYGSPVKIFEYGLMKKPVIAPNVSPVRDVMKHNEDGILVEPNVQSLKEAILKLIREKTFRAKISTSWHEKVLLKYTWDNAARRIIEACT